LLFSKILTECQDNEEEYSKAAEARGESYSTESLFMALIFQQQKMISQLIERSAKSKDREAISTYKKMHILNKF
jgi:hypothetical protein